MDFVTFASRSTADGRFVDFDSVLRKGSPFSILVLVSSYVFPQILYFDKLSRGRFTLYGCLAVEGTQAQASVKMSTVGDVREA